MNMPFDSIESEAIKCLRRAIAAALKGVAVSVQPVSEDDERKLAYSPAVYGEHAIMRALLQMNVRMGTTTRRATARGPRAHVALHRKATQRRRKPLIVNIS